MEISTIASSSMPLLLSHCDGRDAGLSITPQIELNADQIDNLCSSSLALVGPR
jgi:hypothetical protein